MSETNLSRMLSAINDASTQTLMLEEGWRNGRTAFGGLSVALAARAMACAEGTNRPLRTLQVAFVGPVPAESVEVDTRILRRGGSATQIEAALRDGAEVVTRVMATYGNPRPGRPSEALKKLAPNASPEGLAPAPFIEGMPAFLKNMDMRWLGDGVPASGQKSTRLRMWVRHKVPVPDYPVEKLITLADIPPPIMLSHYTDRRMRASSLTWTLDLLAPEASLSGDWFFLDFSLNFAADGYSWQTGHIFAEDGTLCALSNQCMVYFEPKPDVA